MINKNFIYALVGASNNQEKYGYKILKDLLESGYDVVPINPNEKEILGKKVFPKLADVSRKIDVVICVVPPIVTMSIVSECLSLGIKNIWMQPGSESDDAILFCKQHGINVVANSCIMIDRKK